MDRAIGFLPDRLKRLDFALRRPREKASSSNGVPAFTENSVRFQVVKTDPDGRQHRLLVQCDLAAGQLLFLKPNMTEASDTVPLRCISSMEVSSTGIPRVTVLFFGTLREPYTLLFHDKSSQDVFCEVLQSHSPRIIIKGSRANKWIPDQDAFKCMRCFRDFSLTLRRHHCRSCGFVVCADCSSHLAVLPSQGYKKPVRVCSTCFHNIRSIRVIESMGRGFEDDVRIPAEYHQQLEDVTSPQEYKQRDSYGFELTYRARQLSSLDSSELALERNVEVVREFEEEYRDVMEKQRRRWNKYLALHPTIQDGRSLRSLCKQGIPPELRGYLWQILSGSKRKQRKAASGYYTSLVQEKGRHNMDTLLEIDKDLHRTFPNHVAFGHGTGLDTLRRILIAFSVRNPTIGYCQSMNFISALLLLFMEEEDAFWVLTCLLEEIACIDDKLFYHRGDLIGVRIDQLVLSEIVKQHLPQVHLKCEELQFNLESLTLNWFMSFFINTVPLETTLRLWDMIFVEGSKLLLKAGFTLLKLNAPMILKAASTEQLMKILKLLSRNALNCNTFMKLCFDFSWTGFITQHRVDTLRTRFKDTFKSPAPSLHEGKQEQHTDSDYDTASIASSDLQRDQDAISHELFAASIADFSSYMNSMSLGHLETDFKTKLEHLDLSDPDENDPASLPPSEQLRAYLLDRKHHHMMKES